MSRIYVRLQLKGKIWTLNVNDDDVDDEE